MTNDSTAVIILNYKTWQDTLKEIEVCHNVLGVEYGDIIVVDNASPNNSKKELESAAESKGFVFLYSSENRGYAAGNNIGLKYAYKKGYTYGLIINNDIEIDDPNLLTGLKEVFKKDEKIAAVSPDIYSPSGYMFNRTAKKPTFFDMTLGMIAYKRSGRNIEKLDGYAYIYRPFGSCVIVDLSKMAKIDYMDEGTFLYYEEPILAERLLQKGFKCACAYTLKVIHNHSTTVKQSIQKREIIAIKNKSFRYCLEKYRNFGKLKVAICVMFNTIKLMYLDAREAD